MTAQTRPWAGSHPSSDWAWLHNVSASATLAKGEDYPTRLSAAMIWLSVNLDFFT